MNLPNKLTVLRIILTPFYLAAMLVIDYDEELSDKLYDRYCDSVSVISSAIPFEIESIINRYI